MSYSQPPAEDKGFLADLKKKFADVATSVKSALPKTALTDDKAAQDLAGTPSSTYTMAGGKRRKTRKGSKKSRKTRRR